MMMVTKASSMCTSATDASVRNGLVFCQREAPPDRRKRWTPMKSGASGMMSRRTSVTAANRIQPDTPL